MKHSLILLVLAILIIAACQPIAAPELISATGQSEPELPKKILFVGNSLSFFNEGVETHVKKLAASADPPIELEVESAQESAATIEYYWEYYGIPDLIRDGDYDVVVIQSDLPETTEETFKDYAKRFDALIDELDTELILFMGWDYERLGWISQEEINRIHDEVAEELDIKIAPVGQAMEYVEQQHPEIALLSSDAEHPTVHGTYLAAITIYSTLFDRSPVGLSYRPVEPEGMLFLRWPEGGVTEEEAAILQQIAWDTVQAYRTQ
jgi:hypothetical protein